MPKGQPGTLTHGVSAYANRRCKCDICHGAYTAWRRARYGVRPREVVNAEREAPHGTESRYKRCNCDACKTAAATARRNRRHANREAYNAWNREYRRRKQTAAV